MFQLFYGFEKSQYKFSPPPTLCQKGESSFMKVLKSLTELLGAGMRAGVPTYPTIILNRVMNVFKTHSGVERCFLEGSRTFSTDFFFENSLKNPGSNFHIFSPK